VAPNDNSNGCRLPAAAAAEIEIQEQTPHSSQGPGLLSRNESYETEVLDLAREALLVAGEIQSAQQIRQATRLTALLLYYYVGSLALALHMR
jgi:hypothetical protein